MSQGNSADFGAIYRAALAERDPERKLILLRNVKEALVLWQVADEKTSCAAQKHGPLPASEHVTTSIA